MVVMVRFYVVCGAAATTHTLAWLRRGLAGRRAAVQDLTSRWGVVSLQGPSSRDWLSSVVPGTGKNISFTLYHTTCRPGQPEVLPQPVGGAAARADRVGGQTHIRGRTRYCM